jgi:hypothetical protein
MIMSKPLFPMLASIHPVYKLIMLVTAPIAEFECFTQRYLKVLRTLNGLVVERLPCGGERGVAHGCKASGKPAADYDSW